MTQGNVDSSTQGASPLEALRRFREEDQQNRQHSSTSVEPSVERPRTMADQVVDGQIRHSPIDSQVRNLQEISSEVEDKIGDQEVAINSQNGDDKILRFLGNIQKTLFLFTLTIIPTFILPIPWGWSEYSKGIFLVLITILLVTLEVMKMFLSGRFAVMKGFLDIAVLTIFGSYLLSTLFSKDLGSSMYGYDMRLGTGFVAITAMIAFFFVGRSIVRNRSDFFTILLISNIGITLSAFFSTLSFLGVNLFGFIGSMDDLFVPGFPLVAAAVIGLVLWGSGVLISMIEIMNTGERSSSLSILSFILALVDLLAIILFSLGQGVSVLILLAVVLGLMIFLLFTNRKLFTGSQVTLITLIVAFFIVGVVVTQIPSVNEKLVESTDAISQVALPSQITWQIVTNTLSENIGIGLMGFGVDTFSIYYNIYKPAAIGNVDLTNTNFTFGNSEILTLMGNRGVLGALLWLAVGVLIIYQIFNDHTKKGRTDSNRITLLSFDFVLLFLFISSFLVYFGFMLYFLLFMLLSFRVIVGSVLEPRDAETFVMQLDLLVEKVGQNKSNLIPKGLAFITALIGVFLLNLNFNSLRANLYALKAEDRIIEVQQDILEADGDRQVDEPSNYTIDQRETALTEIIDLYAQATNLQPDNSQFHRRRSLILLDYMNLLVEKANTISTEYVKENGEGSDPQESEDFQQVQAQLTQVIEIAVEETRQATELGPLLFSNWDARGYLYSQLVNLNLTSYVASGIAATDRAVRLNPTNYLSYFRAAQLYVAGEQLEEAGATVSRALQINPNHIPSLLLATELSIAGEDFDTAKALLERGLQILEAVEATDSEVYTLMEDRLAQVEQAIENGGVLQGELDPDQLPNENDDPLQGEEVNQEELPDEPVDTGLEGDQNTEENPDTGDVLIEEQP
ncbi:hypothetical protein H6762_01460 [Candidatus Nomurabacteria bacterium]|uniref:Tetratricopeptide repeat protein n=1 Tax=Candidatus Dojkabacteria bacterium TaxID=2099670 RepID=A0A955KWN7_9BACT|nr:hypothetical protein [Candidatus Dojkabacteria bacterium]MCB9789644.1 hypothetical protein [Candidatus Nomurabacteria bacterium]